MDMDEKEYEELEDNYPTEDEDFADEHPEEITEYAEEPSESYVGNGNMYRKRFGLQEFQRTNGDQNFYKTQGEQAENRLEEAKKNQELARAEKNRDFKKKDSEDKSTFKKDGSDIIYKSRKDRKIDKRNLKAANREVKDAKRGVRDNKLNNLKSNIFQATHPLQSAKGAVKKKAKDTANKAIAKAGKKVGVKVASLAAKFLGSKAMLIIAAILIVIGIIAVLVVVVLGADGKSSGGTEYGIIGSKCNYNSNGINSDTAIELINCDATKDNYTVLDTIPLEKYIAGVAIAEIGEDTLNNEEALKAQIIATRSYTLTRNIPEYSVGYDSVKNVIRMRACENDQVYWDYTKDLYRSGGGVAKYSPYEYTPSEGEEPWKSALSEEQITKYESIYQSVLGKYAANVNGKVVFTKYSSNKKTLDGETDKFRILAEQNKGTENRKYTAILMNVYPEVTQINDAECTIPVYGNAGEYSTWKQNASLGAPWANVVFASVRQKNGNIRHVTIDSAGCLIVSIAMQIAHSGIPTGDIIDFNPGTFAEALKTNKLFANNSANLQYGNMHKVIPGFYYTGDNNFLKNNIPEYRRLEIIKEQAEKGRYIVIEVKKHRNKQHWVALDVKNSANTNWEEIYIWDPASKATTISEGNQYAINRIVYFEVRNTEAN